MVAFGDSRLPERFWKKCTPEPMSGCWLWLGSTLGNTGIGWLSGGGQKRLRVNRLAYGALVAEPGDLDVKNKCGLRDCCNPDHMALERRLTPEERSQYKLAWQRAALSAGGEYRDKRRASSRRRYHADLANNRKRGIAHQQKHRYWRKKILNKYGITQEQFEAMRAAQDGRCAICRVEFVETDRKNFRQRACIDHCHKTGKVRGLLCTACNLAIGNLEDDENRLRAAIEYLARSKEAA